MLLLHVCNEIAVYWVLRQGALYARGRAGSQVCKTETPESPEARLLRGRPMCWGSGRMLPLAHWFVGRGLQTFIDMRLLLQRLIQRC